MKLKIDTTEKTIKVEETVNLGALMDKLNTLFPEDEWRIYSLEYYPVYYYPQYPLYVPPLIQYPTVYTTTL